ncbi:hypothetical protein AK964_22280 [Clostridium butyricum]|nr:hypothetical protein AK964_22280 [Clostridium butyricum]
MSLHIASAKLIQHNTANSSMTGRMSQSTMISPNIKLRRALIMYVNGLSFTAIAKPPDKFSKGKRAVLKKNIGRIIAVIIVSYITSFGKERLMK